MTNREKKFIKVGAVVIALLGIIFWGIKPFYAKQQEVRDNIEQAKITLERYHSTLNRKQNFEDKQKILNQEISRINTKLISIDNPNLASSELQKLIFEMTKNAGFEVKSSQPRSGTTGDNFVEIPVEVHIKVNTEQLKDFLFALETSNLMLNIIELQIRVFNERQPDELDVNIKLAGYTKKKETEEKTT